MHHQHGMTLFGTTAFFLFGLTGSIHCLGMCGPLSSFFMMGAARSKGCLLFYHGGRLLSYVLLGLVGWVVGLSLTSFLPVWFFLPLIGGMFLVSIFKKEEIFSFFFKIQQKYFQQIHSFSPQKKALMLGLFTPLLPCGMLYSALVAVLVAPTVLLAILWMIVFFLGTFPLLFAGQMGLQILQRHLPVRVFGRIHQILSKV